jgi:hypothetical protein
VGHVTGGRAPAPGGSPSSLVAFPRVSAATHAEAGTTTDAGTTTHADAGGTTGPGAVPPAPAHAPAAARRSR